MKHGILVIALVALCAAPAAGQNTVQAGSAADFRVAVQAPGAQVVVSGAPCQACTPQQVLIPQTMMMPTTVFHPAVVMRGQWIPRRVGLFGWRVRWVFVPNR